MSVTDNFFNRLPMTVFMQCNERNHATNVSCPGLKMWNTDSGQESWN